MKSKYKSAVKRKKNSSSLQSNQRADRKLVIATYLATVGVVVMVLGVIGVGALFAFYSSALPNPDTLLDRDTELSTKLFDRNGQPIFEVYGEKNRSLITLNEISPNVLNATLAIEDANFYSHRGFYFLGVVRAIRNTITGQGLQGGSTLTQQVVKNAVLTQERTIDRKIKEFILALQLENVYSKDEILQMYLNETPYGGQNYGILTASTAYFNKHPSELTVAEAAYLAGLPQSPSRYSYFGANPQAGLDRKNYVLFLMNTRGWLDEEGTRHFLNDEEYELARNEDIAFQRGTAHFEAPHFVFYVKNVLTEMFGIEMVEQGGLEVTTTLDLDLQRRAQDIVRDEVAKAEYLNVGNGALVAIEPSTGHILSMVGSKDYFSDPSPIGCSPGLAGDAGCAFDPNVNVTTSMRQPGSSIKPITYATMLSQGYPASYPFLDVQTHFPGSSPQSPYIPRNYDGLFRGPMSLRQSLASSLNIPAVKALRISGVDNMIDLAEDMGITTLTERERYGLAITLGGGETKLLELTNAFSAFANKGMLSDQTGIIEVKDARGNVLYSHEGEQRRALSEEVAFLISDILSDDAARAPAFGTGSMLNIPVHDVAVKTGTTDDLKDNYAIGYTPEIVVGVWVGNNNNVQMSRIASGITGATPIWNRFMTTYLSGREVVPFEVPSTMRRVEVDAVTGMLPVSGFENTHEWFINGTQPVAQSEWYQRLEICKIDRLLANDACRDAEETEVKTFISLKAEFPEWQVFVDRWVGENLTDNDSYFPPTVRSQLEFDDDGKPSLDKPVVYVVKPLGDSAPLTFRFEVEVSSLKDIEYVDIYLNDDRVTRDNSFPYGYNFSFEPSEAGEYEFRARARDKDGNTGEVKATIRVGP